MVVFCIRTVKRWESHIVPYWMTGGKARDELVGADQLLLSIVFYIYPNARTSYVHLWWKMVEKSTLGNIYQRGVPNWS